MSLCLFNAQGNFLCNRKTIEGFVQEPDARYSVHILLTMGNSVIYDRIYNNISSYEGTQIANISTQWDKSNTINPVDVRITDNTNYKMQPNIRPLQLLLEYNNVAMHVPFTTGQKKTSINTVLSSVMQRTIDFNIPYFNGLVVSFDKMQKKL